MATVIFNRQIEKKKKSDHANTLYVPTMTFSVLSSAPVLVTPSRPTPNELKYLSDIDDQEALRFQLKIIQYYTNTSINTKSALSVKSKDPVSVIKSALADALVHYYPLAGRLREVEGSSKLAVECNGEGVIFVEADADVTLGEFGDRLPPPLPRLGEFLRDFPGLDGIVGCPLLVVQVTRLACGGFIVAVRHNHTMADAQGIVQFLNTVGELARGESTLTHSPIWDRHILTAQNQPQFLDSNQHQFLKKPVPRAPYGPKFPFEQLVLKSVFFGPKETSALKQQVHERSTTFEVVTAATWKSRTMALNLEPDEEVCLKFIVNVRARTTPPMPTGYYGNAFIAVTAVSTAGNISENSLSYAVQLIKKAKLEITEKSIKPFPEVMPMINEGIANFYIVSDNTRTGFDEVDYGWGKPVFGGIANDGLPGFPGAMCFPVAFKNSSGERGAVVPVCLPEEAMERFEVEIEKLVKVYV